MSEDIRPQYDQLGVEGYYRTHGSSYRNPHEFAVHELLEGIIKTNDPDLSNVLDLACGSGEVTLKLLEFGARVHGIDPFTGAAYLERTGQIAEPLTFEDIANGALEGRAYSLVVCSFALHLVEASRLPMLCYQLARVTSKLVILTPHKRPVIQESWGWILETELLIDRVRGRVYIASG
ncbi:MAG: class I SAM-dependent methyltransferase [Pleurocapsa sp. SU_196_0]|nr:class I SAM-dependent methyltransferase [Pleurocapsa sp. SU_196_0]